MTESATRLTRGPSGWCRAAFCVVVVASASAVGCAAPAAPLPSTPPGAPVVPDVGRLTATRDALVAGTPVGDSVAAAALRSAGLTPAFGGRFVVGTLERPLVAAFLTGGAPGHRDTLVVAMGIGADGAAALLEASRQMAVRSAFMVGPSRSILVSVPFSGTPATPTSDAASAVARVFDASLWTSDGVATVVVVGAGAAGGGAAVAERGLTFTAVEPASASTVDLSALTLAAYDALVASARPAQPPIVSSPDTTAVGSPR